MTMKDLRNRLDKLEARVPKGGRLHVINVAGVHPVGTPEDAPELVAAKQQARAAYEGEHGLIAGADTEIYVVIVNAPGERPQEEPAAIAEDPPAAAAPPATETPTGRTESAVDAQTGRDLSRYTAEAERKRRDRERYLQDRDFHGF